MRYLHVILSTLYSILMVVAGLTFVILYIVTPFEWSLYHIAITAGSWLLVLFPLYEYWKRQYNKIIARYRENPKHDILDEYEKD